MVNLVEEILLSLVNICESINVIDIALIIVVHTPDWYQHTSPASGTSVAFLEGILLKMDASAVLSTRTWDIDASISTLGSFDGNFNRTHQQIALHFVKGVWVEENLVQERTPWLGIYQNWSSGRQVFREEVVNELNIVLVICDSNDTPHL